MKPACFLLLSTLLLAPASADAQPSSKVARLLAARAEAPPEQRPLETRQIRGTATPEQLFFMTGPDNASCVRSVADVTGDGRDEVVIGIDESQVDNVFLLDGASSGAATVVWSIETMDGVSGGSPYGDQSLVPAAVGDFGQQLVALSGGTASPFGEVLWTYPAGASAFAAGVLPDVTGDGVPEALAVLWVGDGSAIRCLNGATGGLVWSSTAVFSNGMMVDLLDDVTGDGTPEVVVSSWENAAIVLDGADGSLVWKTFVGTLNGGDVWTARAIDDLNGDGRQDVVAGSFDYHVYAFDGDDGEMLWSYDTDNRIYSVHPVGDLDGDGRPEVAVGTQDTNNNVVVHVLSGGVSAIFADGFESGDTSMWSAAVP